MQVSQVLSSVSGSSFIGFSTTTVPVLTGGRKNPMQGRVTKIMEGANGQVFTNQNVNAYQNMVNRRLDKECSEVEFVVSPRVWGERISGTPLVMYKDSVYLEVIMTNAGTIRYELDGQPVSKSEIIGLKEKVEGEQGGLENKVIIRTFAESSITQLKINGQVFN